MHGFHYVTYGTPTIPPLGDEYGLLCPPPPLLQRPDRSFTNTTSSSVHGNKSSPNAIGKSIDVDASQNLNRSSLHDKEVSKLNVWFETVVERTKEGIHRIEGRNDDSEDWQSLIDVLLDGLHDLTQLRDEISNIERGSRIGKDTKDVNKLRAKLIELRRSIDRSKSESKTDRSGMSDHNSEDKSSSEGRFSDPQALCRQIILRECSALENRVHSIDQQAMSPQFTPMRHDDGGQRPGIRNKKIRLMKDQIDFLQRHHHTDSSGMETDDLEDINSAITRLKKEIAFLEGTIESQSHVYSPSLVASPIVGGVSWEEHAVEREQKYYEDFLSGCEADSENYCQRQQKVSVLQRKGIRKSARGDRIAYQMLRSLSKLKLEVLERHNDDLGKMDDATRKAVLQRLGNALDDVHSMKTTAITLRRVLHPSNELSQLLDRVAAEASSVEDEINWLTRLMGLREAKTSSENRAATMIQCCYRRRLAYLERERRREQERERIRKREIEESQWGASVSIQSSFRGFYQRKIVHRFKESAKKAIREQNRFYRAKMLQFLMSKGVRGAALEIWAAIAIQAAFRGWLQRSKLKRRVARQEKKREIIRALQTRQAELSPAIHYHQDDHIAATKIQAAFRGWRGRRHARGARQERRHTDKSRELGWRRAQRERAARLIQRWWRGLRCKTWRQCSITIQSAWRSFVSRRTSKRRAHASRTRDIEFTRLELLQHYGAENPASRIQSAWRRFTAKKRARSRRAQSERSRLLYQYKEFDSFLQDSARKIQVTWGRRSGYSPRKTPRRDSSELRELHVFQHESVKKIQGIWRSYRQKWLRKRGKAAMQSAFESSELETFKGDAARSIQRAWLRRMQHRSAQRTAAEERRKALLREQHEANLAYEAQSTKAATVIQTAYRRHAATHHLMELCASALATRCIEEMLELSAWRHESATKIQRFWRARRVTRAKRHAELQRRERVYLEKEYRVWRDNAATSLQRGWRQYVLRKRAQEESRSRKVRKQNYEKDLELRAARALVSHSCTTIQRYWRGFAMRRAARRQLEELKRSRLHSSGTFNANAQLQWKRNAALVVQKAWRGYARRKAARHAIFVRHQHIEELEQRREELEKLKFQDAAALRIQTAYRACIAHGKRRRQAKLHAEREMKEAGAEVAMWRDNATRKIQAFLRRATCRRARRSEEERKRQNQRREDAARLIGMRWRLSAARKHTRANYRAADHAEQRRLGLQLQDLSARTIQAFFKRNVARKARHAEVARMKYVQRREDAARLIGAKWRSWAARKRIRAARREAEFAEQRRQALQLRNLSARTIQHSWRKCQSRRQRVLAQKDEALQVSAFGEEEARYHAALALQRWWKFTARKSSARRARAEMLDRQIKERNLYLQGERDHWMAHSAKKIQDCWGTHQRRKAAKRRIREERGEVRNASQGIKENETQVWRNAAATKIQRAWRRSRSRRRLAESIAKVATIIQQFARQCHARKVTRRRARKIEDNLRKRLYERTKTVKRATLVQTFVRAALATRLAARMCGRAIHMHHARRLEELRRKSATQIQCAFRQHTAQKELQKRKNEHATKRKERDEYCAARKIQSIVRGHQDRKVARQRKASIERQREQDERKKRHIHGAIVSRSVLAIQCYFRAVNANRAVFAQQLTHALASKEKAQREAIDKALKHQAELRKENEERARAEREVQVQKAIEAKYLGVIQRQQHEISIRVLQRFARGYRGRIRTAYQLSPWRARLHCDATRIQRWWRRWYPAVLSKRLLKVLRAAAQLEITHLRLKEEVFNKMFNEFVQRAAKQEKSPMIAVDIPLCTQIRRTARAPSPAVPPVPREEEGTHISAGVASPQIHEIGDVSPTSDRWDGTRSTDSLIFDRLILEMDNEEKEMGSRLFAMELRSLQRKWRQGRSSLKLDEQNERSSLRHALVKAEAGGVTPRSAPNPKYPSPRIGLPASPDTLGSAPKRKELAPVVTKRAPDVVYVMPIDVAQELYRLTLNEKATRFSLCGEEAAYRIELLGCIKTELQELHRWTLPGDSGEPSSPTKGMGFRERLNAHRERLRKDPADSPTTQDVSLSLSLSLIDINTGVAENYVPAPGMPQQAFTLNALKRRLSPHWQAFDGSPPALDWVIANNTPIISTVDLLSHSYGESSLPSCLAALAKNECLEELYAENASMRDFHIEILCTALAENTTLKRIYLDNNQLSDRSGNLLLHCLLQKNSILEYISLSGNPISNSVKRQIEDTLKRRGAVNHGRPSTAPSSLYPQQASWVGGRNSMLSPLNASEETFPKRADKPVLRADHHANRSRSSLYKADGDMLI